MSTLESMRRALRTTAELGQVVRTMKTLSAVSIRQCERAVAASVEYDESVRCALAAVWHELRNIGSSPEGRSGLVLLGSDHGLCGRFNESLIEAAQGEGQSAFRLLVVGERAADLCNLAGLGTGQRLVAPSAVAGITAAVAAVLGVLADWRDRDAVSQVRLWYNRSVEGEPHQATVLTLLPPTWRTLREHPWPGAPRRPGLPCPATELLEPLLEEKLFVDLYRALAESLASEHESRLLAMQAAEHNVQERLVELDARSRQLRQEAITAELLDLMAGFEVLGNP